MTDLLQAVFEGTTAGISVLRAVRDEAGQIIDFDYRIANRITQQLNNRHDLAGQRYSVIHPAYRQAGIFDDFVQVVETGQPIECDRHYTGEGFNNWYATVIVKHDDGVVFSFRDITAERAAQRDIRESDTRFRSLTDTVPAIIWETDPSGYCTYLNRQWYDTTGQSQTEAEGYGWLDATHPDDKAEAGRIFLDANARQVSFKILYRLRHADGAYRWSIDKGSPRFGPDGTYLGMIGTVIDVHEETIARQQLIDSQTNLRASEQRFQAAIVAVQGILWTNNAQGQMEGEQPGWATLTGQTYDEYQGYGWANAVHPDDAQPTVDAWNEAVRQRSLFEFEHRVRTRAGQWEVFSIRATPLLNEDGSIREWVGVHTNIDRQRKAEEALRASEAKLLSLIRSAPVAIGLFMGRDLVIELPNQTFIEVVAKGPDIVGKSLREVMPELHEQPFLQILDDVFTSGKMFQASGAPVQILQGDQLIQRYFNVTFTPLLNDLGEVYAILDISVDVTEQILIQRRIEQSEARFRSLIEEAPVATCLFVGRDLVIEVANEAMIDVWGKGRSVIGQPLAAALPELNGQPFLQILDDVFTTGITFEARATPVDLLKDGALGTYYFDFTYKPLLDEAGQVYAVLDMAIDVTEEVIARRKIEEAEATLRGAVELAQLATWELDIEQGVIVYSPRFMQWLGFSEETQPADDAYNPLPDDYREPVRAALEAAWQPGGTGLYENEHPIINRLTGQVRIIHAQAQVRYDATGKPTHLTGTAQDVTERRRVQQELERLVTERTQQLQALVRDLERSNDNLQQFAYVASHDLQEPLRKIRSFGTMLTDQYATELGEGTHLLDRMQAAAARMSALISDLLTFSRISTRQEADTAVVLNEVVGSVLQDLDLRIEETGAVIEVGALPTVAGDASQLGQLFTNLLSNALKFIEPTTTPHIRIAATRVPATGLPSHVRPTRPAAAYHRIDVADNGIGFDEKYLDRLFQVFQRLHGRGQYAGTGIGLAICEKVAANHGGAITASSQPGEGATFSVFLPVE